MMNSKTAINPEIERDIPVTELNPDTARETVVNPYIEDGEAELGIGTILSGKYNISGISKLPIGPFTPSIPQGVEKS